MIWHPFGMDQHSTLIVWSFAELFETVMPTKVVAQAGW
jgi:hypothetical protein